MRTKREAKTDLSTVTAFHKEFLNLKDQFSNFKVYEKPKAHKYIGFGAGAIYTAQINIPAMSEKAKKKAGLTGDSIQGMIFITSEIWPHNEQGPDMNTTVRTYNILAEFKGQGRITQRRWADTVFIKFYGFSEDRTDLLAEFQRWITESFKPFELSIANKRYRWRK